MTKAEVINAKTELMTISATKEIIHSDKEARQFLDTGFFPKDIKEEDKEKLNRLKRDHDKLSGTMLRLIEREFDYLIKFLAFRFGTPIGRQEDLESEGFAIAIEAIKHCPTENFDNKFVSLVNYYIRTRMYMYFLEVRLGIAVPKSILLAASYINRAKGVLITKGVQSQKIINFLADKEEINDSRLSSFEQKELERCKRRLRKIASYYRKSEDFEIVLERARRVEEMSIGEIDDCSSMSCEPSSDKYVAIGQLIETFRKKLGDKGFKFWIMRQLGYTSKEMIEKTGVDITEAGISYLIKKINKWIEENGGDFIDGGITNEDIRNYIETKAT